MRMVEISWVEVVTLIQSILLAWISSSFLLDYMVIISSTSSSVYSIMLGMEYVSCQSTAHCTSCRVKLLDSMICV